MPTCYLNKFDVIRDLNTSKANRDLYKFNEMFKLKSKVHVYFKSNIRHKYFLNSLKCVIAILKVVNILLLQYNFVNLY